MRSFGATTPRTLLGVLSLSLLLGQGAACEGDASPDGASAPAFDTAREEACWRLEHGPELGLALAPDEASAPLAADVAGHCLVVTLHDYGSDYFRYGGYVRIAVEAGEHILLYDRRSPTRDTRSEPDVAGGSFVECLDSSAQHEIYQWSAGEVMLWFQADTSPGPVRIAVVRSEG